MTYQEVMDFLNGTKKFGSILGLDTIRALMDELGNPQDRLKFVHIAGTNGKGSTASFMSHVLTKAGYKTGLYISPYIQYFGERICINGQMIPDEELCRLTAQVKEACDRLVAAGRQHPTEFELITAVGFLYFAQQKCDIVVLEVGMGGRMDATNIIKAPEVAVIVNIGFDHTEILGDTLEKLAFEKGGIIKEGRPTVLYGQTKEVETTIADICCQRSSELTIADASKAANGVMKATGTLFDYGDMKQLRLGMAGLYQIPNAVTAIEGLKAMERSGWIIPEKAYYEGLAAAVNIGRFELMQEDPMVIVDGAHNPQGIDALSSTLKAVFPGMKFRFMVGMLADKDYETGIKEIAPLAKSFAAITPPNDRCLSADKMAEKIKELTGIDAVAYDSNEKALDTVIAACPKDEVIVVFGSLYQIGDIRRYFGK